MEFLIAICAAAAISGAAIAVAFVVEKGVIALYRRSAWVRRFFHTLQIDTEALEDAAFPVHR